jgi:hypothetical protein
VLEGLLVALSDHLSKGDLVLHSRKPELRNAAHRLILLLLGLFLGLLLLLFVLLASLDLIFGRLDTTVDYRGATLVQRGELAKVLLLKFQDFFLELSLELCVLLLKTLQASDTAADGWRKGFDVARRATNKLTQLALDHGDKGRVASEERGSGGIVKGLCKDTVSHGPMEARGKSESRKLLLTFLNAGNARLLGVRGDRSIVGRRVLRGPVASQFFLLLISKKKI